MYDLKRKTLAGEIWIHVGIPYAVVLLFRKQLFVVKYILNDILWLNQEFGSLLNRAKEGYVICVYNVYPIYLVLFVA